MIKSCNFDSNVIYFFNSVKMNMKKVNKIMLIDDDEAVNFLNQVIIEDMDCCEEVIVKDSAEDAIDYLRDEEIQNPDVILLDINMPRMNGWEFLEKYNSISTDMIPVCMLTTSVNPKEKEAINNFDNVIGFETKPLNEQIVWRILEKL